MKSLAESWQTKQELMLLLLLLMETSLLNKVLQGFGSRQKETRSSGRKREREKKQELCEQPRAKLNRAASTASQQ